MTRNLSPTTLRKVLVHDFRDAVSDFTGDVPGNPDDYTLQAIDTLLGHLRACESYLLMLRYQAERIERCAAMRGMVNDIGPASYEAAEDAAATALAQPSLRERLGRIELGGEVLP